MHVLITGAAGMVGRRLAERLAREGQCAGQAIDRLTLTDVVPASLPSELAGRATIRVEDAGDAAVAKQLAALRPDLIFHLAAIISGEAERDFDKGSRVNLDGMLNLLEAIRHEGGAHYVPKLVFTSSSGIFGAPFPASISDEFHVTPLTSYGTQKAIGELLLCDYSRRGFFDGVGIRLPTICVRPGKPNKAASGFFSNIIREPLNGEEAVLPVSDQVRHWHASPRSAVGFLVHAATMDTAAIGPRRALTMPGYSCTVAEQIEALRKVAGENVVKRIKRVTDPVIDGIVAGWPRNFDPQRSLALGFRAESSFEEIIRVHIDDELRGTFVR